MSPRHQSRTGRASTAPGWAGIRTVCALELRQRLRDRRWYVALGAWAAVVYGMVALSWQATQGSATAQRGGVVYSVTTFFVLGLGLLVAPALTSTAINGDRERGVLALLQATRLTAAEIVLGKLLAGCAAAGIMLLVAAPVYAFSLITGGVGAGGLLAALATCAVCLAAVCAIGVAFSAFTVRTVSSVALTYLTVAFLTVGTPLAFALAMPLTSETGPRQVRVSGDAAGDGSSDRAGASTPRCTVTTETRTVYHSESVWWLLALNPFVVVADAAPGASPRDGSAFAPLRAISDGVRGTRAPEPDVLEECWGGSASTDEAGRPAEADRGGPVWPYGLVALAALGAGATYLTVRRLRLPMRRLPRGVRIA